MNSAPAAPAAPTSGRLHTETAAELHETHTGVVILVGDRAFKCKKPVLTDFLDFRTRESREHACAREVLLNSRFAADSYVGVAHLQGPDGLDEPVIVMRRYADTSRLSTIVTSGQSAEHYLVAIAQQLADFHATAARSRAVEADARVSAIESLWDENLGELRRYTGTVLDPETVSEIERLAHRYLGGRAALFDWRITDRRIVDGHGDLTAGDIFCVGDSPILLDCLDFDDHLRHVDGLDDAAFLAMDLEFLGRADLGEFFLTSYRGYAYDTAPGSLGHFYIAYRAVVRAKVECIRFNQGHQASADDARRHLDIALSHLRSGAVRLILVGGGPGTGKTTVSHEVGKRLGAQVISTDDVRREMTAAGALDGAVGTFNAGLYNPVNVTAVYDTALRRAGHLLSRGETVILDATWRDANDRQHAHDLAGEHLCPVVELQCVLDPDDAAARLRARRGGNSDATPAIAEAMQQFELDWTGAHRISTRGPVAISVTRAEAICRGAV